MNVLITGANGFIGKHMTKKLITSSYSLRLPSRSDVIIEPYTKWQVYLAETDFVIHIAALVHSANQSHLTLEDYRSINTFGTLNLARQAAEAGIKRFIFLSTIKVNGEESPHPYTGKSLPNPQDYYAISKWEAEQGLKEISTKTGMKVVIIRIPLVYGPKVKANFLKLMQWIEKEAFLPFASIDNKRSFIFVGNLVSFIQACLENSQAENQTFLISDGEDLSTPDLLKRLAKAFKKKSRVLPCPPTVLQIVLNLIDKQAEARSLLRSLTLDPTFAYQTLNWTPPFTVDEGLAETVKAYKNSKCFF